MKKPPFPPPPLLNFFRYNASVTDQVVFKLFSTSSFATQVKKKKRKQLRRVVQVFWSLLLSMCCHLVVVSKELDEDQNWDKQEKKQSLWWREGDTSLYFNALMNWDLKLLTDIMTLFSHFSFPQFLWYWGGNLPSPQVVSDFLCSVYWLQWTFL